MTSQHRRTEALFDRLRERDRLAKECRAAAFEEESATSAASVVEETEALAPENQGAGILPILLTHP